MTTTHVQLLDLLNNDGKNTKSSTFHRFSFSQVPSFIFHLLHIPQDRSITKLHDGGLSQIQVNAQAVSRRREVKGCAETRSMAAWLHNTKLFSIILRNTVCTFFDNCLCLFSYSWMCGCRQHRIILEHELR